MGKLQVLHGEGYADDGDGEQQGEEQVRQCEPDAAQDDPHDVAQQDEELPALVAVGRSTTSLPNGQRVKVPMRNAAMEKGMPMIVMAASRPATHQPIAVASPPKSNQMRFPNSRMAFSPGHRPRMADRRRPTIPVRRCGDSYPCAQARPERAGRRGAGVAYAFCPIGRTVLP